MGGVNTRAPRPMVCKASLACWPGSVPCAGRWSSGETSWTTRGSHSGQGTVGGDEGWGAWRKEAATAGMTEGRPQDRRWTGTAASRPPHPRWRRLRTRLPRASCVLTGWSLCAGCGGSTLRAGPAETPLLWILC